MTKFVYVSGDEGLAALFEEARLGASRISEDEARALIRTADVPVVLVLDGRQQPRLMRWAQGFLSDKPTVAVLLLVKALDHAVIPDLIQAGVRDCLPEPLTAAALDRAVRRLGSLVEAVVTQGAGQVVAVVGAKGGVGATTIAVNTATAIARQAGFSPLLIDLHVTGGDLSVFMGVQTRLSVLDALENLHQVDEAFLAGLLEKSSAGVHLLTSSTRPNPAAVDDHGDPGAAGLRRPALPGHGGGCSAARHRRDGGAGPRHGHRPRDQPGPVVGARRRGHGGHVAAALRIAAPASGDQSLRQARQRLGAGRRDGDAGSRSPGWCRTIFRWRSRRSTPASRSRCRTASSRRPCGSSPRSSPTRVPCPSGLGGLLGRLSWRRV